VTAPGALFMLLLGLASMGGAAGVIRSHRAHDVAPGVAANERLTALLSGLLFLLVAAIGVTVLLIQDLLPEHYVVGFLLVPPLGLKLASTGYRLLRYYTGSAAYAAAGPPPILLRLTAPLLVLATIAVFGTGIELWLFGYRFGTWWFQAHVVSFLVWTAALIPHLLGHFRRSAEAVAEEVTIGSSREVFTRRGVVVASLLLGAVLAAASLFYESPFPSFGAGSG